MIGIDEEAQSCNQWDRRRSTELQSVGQTKKHRAAISGIDEAQSCNDSDRQKHTESQYFGSGLPIKCVPASFAHQKQERTK